MVAKGAVISHGSNAVRYSAEKEKAEIVKVNHLPENISSSSMWARMIALQMIWFLKHLVKKGILDSTEGF